MERGGALIHLSRLSMECGGASIHLMGQHPDAFEVLSFA